MIKKILINLFSTSFLKYFVSKAYKILLLGFLLWFILFIIGAAFFFLYESQLMLYKSIMIVASVATGMIFLILYFKKVNTNYLHEGVITGIVWFAVNILLDIIVLVGVFNTPLLKWFIEVGLRYLNIIIMCTGTGWLLKLKLK